MKQRTADHFTCRHSLLQREIPGIKTRQRMSNKELTIAYYFQKMKGILYEVEKNQCLKKKKKGTPH